MPFCIVTVVPVPLDRGALVRGGAVRLVQKSAMGPGLLELLQGH